VLARLMGLAVISPRDLYERMRTEPTRVFDVNPEARWQAARVPGACHLDPLSFTAGISGWPRTSLPVQRGEPRTI
jgi:hypothetical protein